MMRFFFFFLVRKKGLGSTTEYEIDSWSGLLGLNDYNPEKEIPFFFPFPFFGWRIIVKFIKYVVL